MGQSPSAQSIIVASNWSQVTVMCSLPFCLRTPFRCWLDALMRIYIKLHIAIYLQILVTPCTCIADETEDEDVNKEYIEETNRDAVMIAAAKLIASDTVPKVSVCCRI